MEALMKTSQKNTMEHMQTVVQQSNEVTTQTVHVQLSRVNAQLTRLNVEGNAKFKFKEMEERHMAKEARLATLEDPSNI